MLIRTWLESHIQTLDHLVRKQVPTRYVISALNEVIRADVTNVSFAAPELAYAD